MLEVAMAIGGLAVFLCIGWLSSELSKLRAAHRYSLQEFERIQNVSGGALDRTTRIFNDPSKLKECTEALEWIRERAEKNRYILKSNRELELKAHYKQ